MLPHQLYHTALPQAAYDLTTLDGNQGNVPLTQAMRPLPSSYCQLIWSLTHALGRFWRQAMP